MRIRSERRSLLYGPLPDRERCVELLAEHERMVLRERDWARFCMREGGSTNGAYSTWTPLVFFTYPDLDPTNNATREFFRSDKYPPDHTAPQRRK